MTSRMNIKRSTEETNEIIHRMLQKYNAKYMSDTGDYSYFIEENGDVAAGIVANSVFDTLEVDYLCVAEEYRNRGYGEALLKKIEREAEANQIKRIILNTYSFQAPLFYEKLGYRQLFSITPVFKDYSQYYFIKEL